MNVPTTASVQTRTAPRLRRWLVIATVAAGLSGCAGALGVYVPGSGNKAGTYRTATSLGKWTLVGCTVAPGFEFASFELAPPDWRPTPRAPRGR